MTQLPKIHTKPFYFSIEGQCEELYLNKLQELINNATDYFYKVNFAKRINKNPQKSLRNFSKIKKGCKIYCIYDYEGIQNDAEFRSLLKLIKNSPKSQNPFVCAYSNLSFELWIILHKQDYKKKCSGKHDYLPIINTAYKKDFESLNDLKKEKNFRELLETITLKDVLQAIKRSKEIMIGCENDNTPHNCNGHKYYQENPSLSIWECINTILEECKEKD